MRARQKIPTAGKDLLARAHIAAQIEEKVAPVTVASLGNLVEHLPIAETLLQTSLEPSKPFLRDLAHDNKYLEWMTNIKAEKHTLDSAYSVHVFLGPPDDEIYPAEWPASPTHVEILAPLGQPSTTACGKCQDDQRIHTQVTGHIPLTMALVERCLAGIVAGLKDTDVVDYLTKELHWRVVKSDGTVVDNKASVDGLKVFIVSNEVTIPDHDTVMPIYVTDVTISADIMTKAQGGGRGDGIGLAPDELPW